MALPATENFTGSNGDQVSTLANWTANSSPDLDIQSNAAQTDKGSDECADHWDADAFNNDQYAEATVTALANGIFIGVGVRSDTGGALTNYGWYGTPDQGSQLFKNVSGVWTQIGSTGGNFSVNDVIRLEVNGTTLTPKINGSTEDPPGAQTDSSISSGSAGIAGWDDGASQLDNWEGGNLAAAAAALPIFPPSDAIHSLVFGRVTVR